MQATATRTATVTPGRARPKSRRADAGTAITLAALMRLYGMAPRPTASGPHAGIWNAPECFCEAGSVGKLILCSAPLDALTFWGNGVRNVTFIVGTEGFPKVLLEALLAHRIKSVWLAYDTGEAGNRAAERDAKRLTAHGIECFRIKFPLGMNANEYAQNSPPFSLAMAVNAAEWLDLHSSKSDEGIPPSPDGLRWTSGGTAGGLRVLKVSVPIHHGEDVDRRSGFAKLRQDKEGN